MHPTHRQRIHMKKISTPKKQGSALLVTLLVVSLLLMVSLAFTALVRVELRKMIADMEGIQARNNARLGAELAVGRLQELMGPDTRVSATGDLFHADANNVYRPGLARGPQRQHWVGAWDSEGFDENNATSKPFLGWIVSGPDTNSLQSVSSIASAPAAGDVRVVGPGSVSRPEDEVRVAMVDLAGDRPARFGYWVGDEGTKARFNLQDPFRGTDDFTRRQYSMRAAQRHAAELFTYDPDGLQPLSLSGWYPLDNADFAQLRERLVGPPQVPLLGWNSESLAAFQSLRGLRFHDFSLVSQGLMTNTAQGGLRRDLSLAFEMPITDFLAHPIFGSASPHAENPVYRPPGFPATETITPLFRVTDFSPFGFQPENSPDGTEQNPPKILPPVLRGPSWQILRNYHRSYKQTDPDRSRYGLNPNSYRTIGGRQVAQGRSMYPNPETIGWMRRYGQEASVWTYAEMYGPNTGPRYTMSRPLEQPVHPGVSPLVTRVQIVFSVRTEPEIVEGVATGNYIADVYLDPLVTLWNPYNVPLATGAVYGQPLQLSFRFIDLFMVMQVEEGTTEYRRLRDLFEDTTGNTGSYDGQAHEAFQLTLDQPSGLVLEPGEVVIFSGVDQEVRYQRIAGTLRHTDYSGVNLDLHPGITSNLNTNSGIRFSNPWNISLPPDAEIRFRTMNVYDAGVPGRDGNWTQKIQVAGVNRTTIVQEPFFGSFDASNVVMATPFSAYYPVQDMDILQVKRPFFLYDAFLKAENSLNPVNLMSQFNLRAPSMEQGNTTNMESNWFAPAMRVGDLWGGRPAQVNGWNGLFSQFVSNVGRRSYWGGSNNAAGGSQFVTLFELPRLPPMSLGSLQHAQVVFMADDPSLAIGNSIAPVMVRANEKLSQQQLNTRNSGNVNTNYPNILLRWADARTPSRSEWTFTRVDWSYWLNQALWDDYFFSSLTPDPSTGASTLDRFNAFMNGEPLPNSTVSPYLSSSESVEELRSRLFNGNDIQRLAPDRVAANLMQDGAFNINSTSVEAWRALLSSSRNLIINLQNQSQPRELTGTAFTRTALPFDAENDRWHGFRNLTDSQINTLAHEIVREVRVRGPFLNLSDFINRRLHPNDHPSQLSGPLQAAIDALTLNQNFNRSLQGGGLQTTHLNDWVRDRVDFSSMVAEAAPGYFLQADLLTLIGPMLSARSDTFTVRAYGEYAGARAWCELTVQRVPDFVDDRDDPATPPANLHPVNQTFGRRFVITNFRWLNEEDV